MFWALMGSGILKCTGGLLCWTFIPLTLGSHVGVSHGTRTGSYQEGHAQEGDLEAMQMEAPIPCTSWSSSARTHIVGPIMSIMGLGPAVPVSHSFSRTLGSETAANSLKDTQ